MHILDPSRTDQAVNPNPNNASQLPPQQLPRDVRKFGFIPDCTLWKPGDLLLFSSVRRDSWQDRIVTAQKNLGFTPQHAEWHHAAVYVGDRHVCEARPGGTRYRPVDDLVVDHRIRARRGVRIIGNDGFRIAIFAMTRLGWPYDYKTAFLSWIDALLGRLNRVGPVRTQQRRAVQCARLFHDAYLEATGYSVVNKPDPVVMPAALSGCGGLMDVPSQWLKL